jgi:hypothetical protein
MSDADYEELIVLTEKFQKGLGLRLQRYLWLKSLLSTNYVCSKGLRSKNEKRHFLFRFPIGGRSMST